MNRIGKQIKHQLVVHCDSRAAVGEHCFRSEQGLVFRATAWTETKQPAMYAPAPATENPDRTEQHLSKQDKPVPGIPITSAYTGSFPEMPGQPAPPWATWKNGYGQSGPVIRHRSVLWCSHPSTGTVRITLADSSR